MIIKYIRYKLPPEERRAFIDAYAEAAADLDASPFCMAYELSECEEEEGQFILRIEWTSTAEHMQGFRKSAQFPPFFAKVKPYFNRIGEMRHYRVTEVVHRK